MIDRIKQYPLVIKAAGGRQWAQASLVPRMKKHRLLSVTAIACLLAALYWGLIASDRYVSEAHVIIQRTDTAMSQSMDLGSLISGTSGANHADQLLLRDYLLSTDMMIKLDQKLDLREHYSNWHRDPLSRMWSKDAPQERFYNYFRSRVSVDFDDYAGVLIISVQAFDEKMAHAITTAMIEEGERNMNRLSHLMAQEQVTFVETQVNQAAKRFHEARSALIAYQNQKGIASPTSVAENVAGVINRLDAKRADLEARRLTLLGYLTPDAPNVVELDLQLEAINKQIEQEQGRLTTTNGKKTLNSTVEEYQRLELQAGFAEDVYKTALIALEKGRVEATRAIKKVTILQNPTMPQYPLEPTRIYNILVFILITLMIAGILHMLAAIIRDHKD